MRLSLIAVLVPDYDEGIAFFDALGFGLVQDEPRGPGKRWVVMRPQGGGSDILLARAVEDQRAAIGRQAGGRVGFFLTTTDFAGDAERIEAAGGTFEERPRDEEYGRVAVFRDPWGNRWDLIEPFILIAGDGGGRA
ncbi:VOC family protein [Psychromarinibacter sp. S121]|uniref:VOC family protein n=1 Tax=Psychromarinibacter sp. S121 TaxID=3415127 RepID=UPI003C7A3E7E